MHIESNNIQFSPSDLTVYMDSPFASWMDHLALTNPKLAPTPDEDDDLISTLQKKGFEHELATLASFEDNGSIITDLSKSSDVINDTILAMKSGVDIIYQGALSLHSFRGFVDFLVKVPGNSVFGDFHYEVWDTKLSKSVKSSFVVQLCCFVNFLSPSNILISIDSISSVSVVYFCILVHGIIVPLGINVFIIPPDVSIPTDKLVLSIKTIESSTFCLF